MIESIDNLVPFRDDLRQPKISFGRCCLTGEWGKCVALDLGDISIQMPDIERGVEQDPESRKVRFKYWTPVVFQNQATFSEDGLKKLLNYMESQENPIPCVCPDLVYKWQAGYIDGTVISQFQATADGTEEEISFADIVLDRVSQFSIVPRYVTEEVLPTYTLVKETGKIFKAGVELDLMYDGVYQPESDIVYARKVTCTFTSQVQGLNRYITNTYTTVLQLLGWKIGGLKGPGPGLIIAIDERGNWRPWEFS